MSVLEPPGTDTSSYFLNGGDVGVLLLHGFTASPFGLRFLADNLAENGISVYVPRIAGHGTHYTDLVKTTWKDWYRSAVEALDFLYQRVDTIFVSGHSMGGVLALRLAQEYKVKGLLIANTPIYLEGWFFNFMPVTKIFVKYIMRSKHTLEREWAVDITYTKFPVTCIDNLRRLVRLVKSDLDRVAIPAVIAQAAHDHLVPFNSGKFIYDQIKSTDKLFLEIPNSGHYIENLDDREKLKETAVEFVKRNT